MGQARAARQTHLPVSFCLPMVLFRFHRKSCQPQATRSSAISAISFRVICVIRGFFLRRPRSDTVCQIGYFLLQIMSDTAHTLIRFEDRETLYEFSEDDFRRVEEYCENECLGIQFLQSANVLRKLVKSLQDQGAETPYTLEALGSRAVEKDLKENGEMKKIEALFGSSDLPKIARIVAKQTHSFIHKT